MDIVGWLRSFGLGRYEAAFRENEIDETILPGLTAEDLKELGVAALGHRRKLLDAIAALGTRRGSECRVVALASAAARLMRAYSAQVETLRRLRPSVTGGTFPDGGSAVFEC